MFYARIDKLKVFDNREEYGIIIEIKILNV
jgi:hypothetical protein